MKQSERGQHLDRVKRWLLPIGRIGRARYWGVLLLIGIGFFALFTWLEFLLGYGTSATWILYPPFFWAMLLLCVRRYHDLGKSGWWLLLILIPVIGLIWVPLELGFRRGDNDSNRFGRDPAVRPDYMTVA